MHRRRCLTGSVVALVVALSAVATGAVAANFEGAAQCSKRRGYGPNDKPPVFYNYFTTVPGTKRHVQQSRAMSGVLLPSFAHPDATVYLRFDTYPNGWRANFAYHAGCDDLGEAQEDWGYLGWEIVTDAKVGGGVVCDQSRSLSCFAKKRLNLGGRIVTQLTPRGGGYDKHPFYIFTAGGRTYWVNGQRPRSRGWTQEQHNKWVESRIRTARRVG